MKTQAAMQEAMRALPPRLPNESLRTAYPGVYFVRWNEFIKIGVSNNVIWRCRALWHSIPTGDLQPLAWIPMPVQVGDVGAHEARIHYVLRDYRARGEWFHDCPTVRRFIDRYGYPWPEVSGE